MCANCFEEPDFESFQKTVLKNWATFNFKNHFVVLRQNKFHILFILYGQTK